jgi:hypothetical protein
MEPMAEGGLCKIEHSTNEIQSLRPYPDENGHQLEAVPILEPDGN